MAHNADIERWLDSHGVEWTYRANLPTEEIDRLASHRNQARIAGPINEDTVVLYAAAMEGGSKFPPVVVWQRPDTKYVVVDGNHRVAAYDLAEIDKTDAYVTAQLTDGQKAALTYEANTKHGLPTSLDERLRQAVNLVEMGTTQKGASQMLGIPSHKVMAAYQAFETDKRMQRLGVARWDQLGSSLRRRLNAIRDDDVFAAAAQVAIESKMTTPEISEFVVRINEIPRATAQMEIVARERASRKRDIRSTAGGRIGFSRPTTRLSSILSNLIGYDPTPLTENSIGEELRQKLYERTEEALAQLNRVSQALKKES